MVISSFNCCIKTHDGWETGFEFLGETTDKRAHSTTAPCKKIIIDLNVELGHPSVSITLAITKILGIPVTGIFKLSGDSTFGKAKH